MSTRVKVYMFEVEYLPGTFIGHAAQEAVSLCRLLGARLRFVFNDIELIVAPGEKQEDVVARYQQKANTARAKL